MSEATHTPGPWQTVRDSDRITIASKDQPWIADLFELSDYAEDEVEANARLIAAAPELLEVCEIIRDSLGIRDDFTPLGTLEFAPQLMAAIAKARGESPVGKGGE